MDPMPEAAGGPTDPTRWSSERGWSDELATRGGEVEVLDVDECRALLARHQVGRLAYDGGSGVRIVPLSYTFLDQFLLFRTGPGSDVGQEVPGRWVAFEVDDLDESRRTGWSVQVRGPAELLPPASLGMLDLPQTPEPWARGDRCLVVRLPLSVVTGRRVRAG